LNFALLLIAIAAALALLRRRYRLSLLLLLCVPLLAYAEMDQLRSPVSGLLTVPAHNIIATFQGPADAPLIVFSAHYDSATQLGDHIHWQYAAIASGAGLALACGLAIFGITRRSRFSRPVLLAAASLLVLPFVVSFAQQSVGPFVRHPSPGALDNAGSVAVLLKLAERLKERSGHLQATVQLAFLSCEEERAIGSWRFARDLRSRRPIAIVNLEAVGGTGPLAYAEEESFLVRRYQPTPSVIQFLQQAARGLGWEPLRPMPLPGVMYTDGRSFLASGLPAATILSYSDGGPRNLHSVSDNRNRLSVASLQQAVAFLETVVATLERERR